LCRESAERRRVFARVAVALFGHVNLVAKPLRAWPRAGTVPLRRAPMLTFADRLRDFPRRGIAESRRMFTNVDEC
jgi:hypothetical protein